MKKAGIILSLLFIILSVSMTACGGGKQITNSATTISTPIASQKFDEKAVLKETQVVIKNVSEAIATGNGQALLDSLETSTDLQLSDLNLSSPEAKQLATAISNAKATEVLPNIVYYESMQGSESISFYIIKEDGEWKFGGF